MAPHLAGSSRLAAREPLSSARRAEPREGGKKKFDDRDDWRKGEASRYFYHGQELIILIGDALGRPAREDSK